VDVIYGAVACEVSHAVKICVYRFVQEGLSNAFRHAGTDGSVVSCRVANSILSVSVLDRGGASDNRRLTWSHRLARKVESLGGAFQINPEPGKGTQIEMQLTIEGGEHNG
jgi:signal transduction histidine kinase